MEFDFQPDYIRAEARSSNEPLPRIPPLRLKFGINYSNPHLFNARVEAIRNQKQSRTADFETDTDAFTVLNLVINKEIILADSTINLFLKGTNLTNTTIRDHVSFLKDIAPQAGRSAIAGLQVSF